MRGSCKSQLLVTVHCIAEKLALGDQVDVILLDLSKAFDKVSHQRLLHQLLWGGQQNPELDTVMQLSCSEHASVLS